MPAIASNNFAETTSGYFCPWFLFPAGVPFWLWWGTLKRQSGNSEYINTTPGLLKLNGHSWSLKYPLSVHLQFYLKVEAACQEHYLLPLDWQNNTVNCWLINRLALRNIGVKTNKTNKTL